MVNIIIPGGLKDSNSFIKIRDSIKYNKGVFNVGRSIDSDKYYEMIFAGRQSEMVKISKSCSNGFEALSGSIPRVVLVGNVPRDIEKGFRRIPEQVMTVEFVLAKTYFINGSYDYYIIGGSTRVTFSEQLTTFRAPSSSNVRDISELYKRNGGVSINTITARKSLKCVKVMKLADKLVCKMESNFYFPRTVAGSVIVGNYRTPVSGVLTLYCQIVGCNVLSDNQIVELNTKYGVASHCYKIVQFESFLAASQFLNSFLQKVGPEVWRSGIFPRLNFINNVSRSPWKVNFCLGADLKDECKISLFELIGGSLQYSQKLIIEKVRYRDLITGEMEKEKPKKKYRNKRRRVLNQTDIDTFVRAVENGSLKYRNIYIGTSLPRELNSIVCRLTGNYALVIGGSKLPKKWRDPILQIVPPAIGRKIERITARYGYCFKMHDRRCYSLFGERGVLGHLFDNACIGPISNFRDAKIEKSKVDITVFDARDLEYQTILESQNPIVQIMASPASGKSSIRRVLKDVFGSKRLEDKQIAIYDCEYFYHKKTKGHKFMFREFEKLERTLSAKITGCFRQFRGDSLNENSDLDTAYGTIISAHNKIVGSSLLKRAECHDWKSLGASLTILFCHCGLDDACKKAGYTYYAVKMLSPLTKEMYIHRSLHRQSEYWEDCESDPDRRALYVEIRDQDWLKRGADDSTMKIVNKAAESPNRPVLFRAGELLLSNSIPRTHMAQSVYTGSPIEIAALLCMLINDTLGRIKSHQEMFDLMVEKFSSSEG